MQLIPSDDKVLTSTVEELSDEDDVNDNNNNTNITSFPPGRFECPCVFRRAFPLHWRLRPNQALSKLISDLQAMAISNRKNMIVYASADVVYYIRISESYTREEKIDEQYGLTLSSPQVDDSTDSTIQDSPEKTEVYEKMITSLDNDKSPKEKLSKAASSMGGGFRGAERYLIISVFGVQPPGKEIMIDFVGHLETKLNSITYTAIAQFLSRNVGNTSLKLTFQDMAFLLPRPLNALPDKIIEPSDSIAIHRFADPLREFYRLPKTLNVHLQVFVRFLKQNLMKYLNIFSGHDVTLALEDHYKMAHSNRSSLMPLISDTSRYV